MAVVFSIGLRRLQGLLAPAGGYGVGSFPGVGYGEGAAPEGLGLPFVS